MKKSILILLSALLASSFAFAQNRLQNGIWHATLQNSISREIPFNFEVKDTLGKKEIVIINGNERFKVPDVKQVRDSVFIHMPLFDSEFKARLVDGKLQGNWIKHLPQKDVAMAFAAEPGNYRFFKDPKAACNVQGRWSAIFASGDTTVAEFKQADAKVTGTFLTTTGDYRYLEGTTTNDSLYLSCFDGGHAFLFTAAINHNNNCILTGGKFYSGYSGSDEWSAIKDPNAKLPDAYSLTALKPGYTKMAFTFTDLNGKKVSLSDARFKNKVVILQIMGSWCPNCMDETAYLVNFYKKYHPKGVEIVGLAYERSTDFARSKKSIEQLKKRFNITYPVLITGYTNDKKELTKSLPMLANFLGFPTTIIIDKKGDVRKIHTGFSGPGTGNYYAEFISEFEKLNDDLLAEK
ncbi:redoxin [Mucilaginibacter sp. PPCGB 2223]|uniref:TlpA disulfide reductase family protein n=1 Tax=Mucilaginibacter sp. PPCGB 2223 TaxID=1886027 RepID=UPI0008262A49|nr:TlpA disulfide reductase family protein [Mucilaginibacter sp. PPCGB 2223]OCX50941.1 redoxin [Mucilaginibacter sp. PPCGB 2223]